MLANDPTQRAVPDLDATRATVGGPRSAVRRRSLLPWLVLALMALTLILRTWRLDTAPPWLWWDEATQGLDARDLLSGHFRVFFPSAMGKEPLYIYLTTPFVAAWDGHPFAVRLAGALTGVLMVPALFYAGRALWPKRRTLGAWAGLAAAAFWATNFWPQSINRIGFQVNPFPLIFTLALITWLNYVRRPTQRRAIVFGLLAGLTLTTYIAARVTPLLWMLLYAALPRPRRAAMRGTLRWAILVGCLVVAPLAVHFALHPDSFFQRVGSADVVQTTVEQATPDTLLRTVKQLMGGFLGVYGDPISRHNIPNRPPFSPPLAILFGVGFVTAVVAALRRRDQAGITLLLGWAIACVPFVVTIPNAPHFTRQLGSLPFALLLAAAPIGWLAEKLNRPDRRPARLALGAALAALVVFEAGRTIPAYFVTWVHEPDLYDAYQGDTWTYAERVVQTPGAPLGVVPLNPGYGLQMDYSFRDAPIFQWEAGQGDVEGWLASRLRQAGGRQVVTPVWIEGANLTADARQALPFYLAREGAQQAEQPLRGFNLLTFELGSQPQFSAPGQAVSLSLPFPPDLTLLGGRWGAAYPNPDRNATTAAAGTSLWAILTWRLDHPLPDMRVAVDLVDETGHRLTSAEMPLMDLRQRDTTPWPTGATFETDHLIPVPATQPAGSVRLEVRVYNARTLEPLLAGGGQDESGVLLAEATVTPARAAPDAAQLHIGYPLAHAFPPGIELLGADAWLDTVSAGHVLPLKLYWRVTDALAQPRHFSVRLGGTDVQADVVIPAGTPAGQIIHTYADLHLPADLVASDYGLLVAPDRGTPVSLGTIAVTNRPRRFEAPTLAYPDAVTFGGVVQLLGVTSTDPEATAGEGIIAVAAGQPLTLTLAWQALSTPQRDLVRFVHLLGPDGRPVAQEDTRPCAGACPAPSWLPGEVLVERAHLTVPANLAAGTYRVAVGWYDAATFQRLAIRKISTPAQVEDIAILPFGLVISN